MSASGRSAIGNWWDETKDAYGNVARGLGHRVPMPADRRGYTSGPPATQRSSPTPLNAPTTFMDTMSQNARNMVSFARKPGYMNPMDAARANRAAISSITPANDYRDPNEFYPRTDAQANPNFASAEASRTTAPMLMAPPSQNNLMPPGMDQRSDHSQQSIASQRNAPVSQIPYPAETSNAQRIINQYGGVPQRPQVAPYDPDQPFTTAPGQQNQYRNNYLREQYEQNRMGQNNFPSNMRGDILRSDVRSGVPLDTYTGSDVLGGRGDRGNDRLNVPFAQTKNLSQGQQEILQGERRINYGLPPQAPAAPVVPLDKRPNAQIYLDQLKAANSPSGRRDESFQQAAPGYIPMGRATQETRSAESEKTFRDRQNAVTGYRDQAQAEVADMAERRAVATEARMSQPNRQQMEQRRQTARQAEETAYGRERQAEQDAVDNNLKNSMADKNRSFGSEPDLETGRNQRKYIDMLTKVSTSPDASEEDRAWASTELKKIQSNQPKGASGQGGNKPIDIGGAIPVPKNFNELVDGQLYVSPSGSVRRYNAKTKTMDAR